MIEFTALRISPGDINMIQLNSDTLSSFLKIINTDTKNFTSDIIENILATPQTSINTAIIYEDEDIIWQMCYMDDNTNPINHIASYISQDKKTIYGNVVLFGSKVNELGSCDEYSITTDDLLKLIKRRQIHIGCNISISKQITEFTYDNTLQQINLEELTLYEFQLYGASGFNFQLFYDNNKTINKLATCLTGIKVYGNVILISKSDEHTFVDVNKSTLLRLINVCKCPIEYHQSHENESKIERDNKKLLIVKNKWWYLKKRELEITSCCWVCKNKSKLLCSGCHRLRYCSPECRLIDWHRHQRECCGIANINCKK
jgi:hypothetical protein